MDNINRECVYGRNAKVRCEKEFYNLISYESVQGMGVGVAYKVLSGLEIIFNEFHTTSIFSKQCKCNDKWLTLNYCIEGRFECKFLNNKYNFLNEGDLLVTSLEYEPVEYSFPLKYYKGITILIDVKKIMKNELNLFSSFNINIEEIYKRLNLEKSCYAYRSVGYIKRIFNELYNSTDNKKMMYSKLKVLEILYLLYDLSGNYECSDLYFSSDIVKKVKRIEKEIVEAPIGEVKIEDLVSKYEISMTNFKKCFKELYGDTPYSYNKKFKMNQAAKILKDLDKNINEIAIELGYKNASKFSDAFKSVFGVVPSKYRKSS